MKILNSVGLTKIDMMNMASASKPYKSMVDQKFQVVGAALAEDGDSKVSYLKADNGDIYAGNSDVIASSIDLAIDAISNLEPGQKLFVTVKTDKSNGNKDFLYLKWSEE